MSNIAKEILANIQKGQIRTLTGKIEQQVKELCPIRSGNMLNHIKPRVSPQGKTGTILIRAYKYDENIYNYSLKRENYYFAKHSHKYIMANLESSRYRFNTYYGTGVGLDRKYYPRGVVNRIKGVSPHSDFNYASHTNDARTRNKGWVYLALRVAINDFCSSYDGSIEQWNLH